MLTFPSYPVFPEKATILSYVSQGKREEDWNPETDAHMVLNRLGITDHEEEIDHLSGERKKSGSCQSADQSGGRIDP